MCNYGERLTGDAKMGLMDRIEMAIFGILRVIKAIIFRK